MWPASRPGPFGPLAGTTGGRSPVDFVPGARLRIRAELAFGVDITADPSTWTWTDVTSRVLFHDGITESSGRRDEASQVVPGTGRLVLKNADGYLSRKNPSSPYYGQITRNTPIRVTLNAGSADYPMIEMYVNEWRPRWDKTNSFRVVEIECGGVLRRLDNAPSSTDSPLRRTVLQNASVIGYWPLEDGANATSGAEVKSGSLGSAFIANGDLGFGDAAVSELPGSNTLIKPHVGSSANAQVPVFPASWTTATRWSLSWVQTIPRLPTPTEVVLFETWHGDDSARHWLVVLGTDGKIYLRVYNQAGTELISDTGTTFNNFPAGTFSDSTAYGHWLVWSLVWVDSGGSAAITIKWEAASATITKNNTLTGHLPVYPYHIKIPAGPSSSDEFGLGHIVLALGSSAYNSPSVAFGYPGEVATTRLARLCGEQGIAFTLRDGIEASSTQMGPQPLADLTDLLRECEQADGGVLFEDGFGLTYQTRTARYDAPVALTMVEGRLSEELEPADDDQQLRNVWTITRKNGSSVVAYDTDSIATEGVELPANATLNLYADSQLEPAAYWKLHSSINDEIRWPSLTMQFARLGMTDVLDTWIGMQLGDRLVITGIPTWVDVNAIDAFWEGRSQRVDSYSWEVSINTSPARPSDVFQIEGPANLGRLGLDSTLGTAVNTTDTSWSVTTTNLPLLSTLASDYPADGTNDWIIDGERIMPVSVTGSSSPQTVTVVRSVNGVVKTHDVGAVIDLYRPGVIGR